jgi:hypothetical protein
MRSLPALLFTFCALPFEAVLADGVPTQPAPSAWQPVDAAALDAARGGFTLPSGLAVGLGIERMIAVNGELVTQARFAIADVRALNADQAAMVREAMSATLLVQNGRLAGQSTGGQLPAPAASLPGLLSGPVPGPLAGQLTGQLAGQLAGQLGGQLPGPVSAPSSAAMPAALPPPAAAMFIQNSLDNQRIQSQLVIDASVNTLSGFKSLNFSSSVLDALANAARQH